MFHRHKHSWIEVSRWNEPGTGIGCFASVNEKCETCDKRRTMYLHSRYATWEKDGWAGEPETSTVVEKKGWRSDPDPW